MKNFNLNNCFRLFFTLLFLFILAFFLFRQQSTPISDIQTRNLETNGIQYLKIAGKILKVDLALTPEAQAQGLSGRKELKEDEGMLFVFDYTEKYPFWMKDMNFPIDIIWISDDLRVVYIKKNALPESYPETYSPDSAGKYVLEVISSFSEKNNLKVEDKVEFFSS